MELNDLAQRRGEWLRGTGAESDIVLSSRIRLARNLVQFPFINRADDTVRAEIERTVRSQLTDVSLGGPRTYLEVDHLERLDRQFLVERQLISRELADSHGARAVYFTDEENVSLMVNEEDHLRMQVFHSGFDLDACWQQISRLDDQLEDCLPFSYSQELGYLTACPTNAGTGIRVSVLLHLPGLVMTGEVKKVFTALQKINLAVRGLYGEGTQAMGDFYQISNQITLGKAEEKLIRSIKDVVPNIIAYERRVRKALVEENRAAIHDKIARAYGTLRSAQAISSQARLRRSQCRPGRLSSPPPDRRQFGVGHHSWLSLDSGASGSLWTLRSGRGGVALPVATWPIGARHAARRPNSPPVPAARWETEAEVAPRVERSVKGLSVGESEGPFSCPSRA